MSNVMVPTVASKLMRVSEFSLGSYSQRMDYLIQRETMKRTAGTWGEESLGLKVSYLISTTVSTQLRGHN